MSDEGEEPPQRRLRNSKRSVLVSSGSSSSESDDSGPATSTRRKRLRVVSEESSESSGSSVCDPRRRRRTLPQLRDSEGSGWESERSSAHNSGVGHKGTSKSGFASDSSEGNSDKCSICLMRFKDQLVGTPQSCEHIFCLDCITEWSKNVNTCPVDRSTFDAIVVRSGVGGRVLRSQPVQPLCSEHNTDSMDIFFVDNDTPCQVCGDSREEDTLLLCDHCDLAYHMACLSPPLTTIPIDDWYCPHCADGDSRAPLTITLEGILGAAAADVEYVAVSSRSTRRRVSRPSSTAAAGRASAAAPRHTRHRIRRDRAKRRRKKKVSRRRAQTAARRSHVRASVRAALAAQLPALPPPAPAPRAALHALAVPRLSLFHSPELDYFSGDEDEGGAGEGAVAGMARASSAAHAAHRLARRKLAAAPSPPRASADLLSDILDSQARLHSRRSLVSLSSDGVVSIQLVQRPRARREPAPAPAEPAAPRLDPRAATERGVRRPAYGGRRSGGGWGGGYRYPAGAPPPRAAPAARDSYAPGPPQRDFPPRYEGARRDPNEGGFVPYDDRRGHRYEDERLDRERRRREDERRYSAGGGGPAWDPGYRREPPQQQQQQRHSFGGYEGALDMRTAPASSPPPSRPAPAPSAEDDRSDESLVIDTEKYDPTEPTHDEDSGSERSPPPAPPPPAPAVPPLAPPASLAAVEHMLAGTGPRVADSDDDSDGDCPNFSIYSATSVHIASAALAPPPPMPAPPPALSGLEDLVQEDGGAEPPRPPPLPPPPRVPPDLDAALRRKSDEYKEKVSKRCPITTNTRNPIKIKLNAPSLIRRQVSLYDEEDAEEPEECAEPSVEPPAEPPVEPPVEPLVKPLVEPLVENPVEPLTEVPPREESVEDAPADRESPAEEEPMVADTPPRRDDEDRNNESPEDEAPEEEPPTPRSLPSPRSERSPSPRALAPEHEDATCGTPSLPDGDAAPRSGSDSDTDSDEDAARLTAALEKMTESISETEDERSYTPCLDERRPPGAEPPPDTMRGLDTEMISEDEGDEMFSEERRSPPPSPPAESAPAAPAAPSARRSASASPSASRSPSPAASPAPAPDAAADAGKKRKRKEAKREGKERKTKAKRGEVAFKKLGKGKERNYRARDKDAEPRRRRSSSSERARSRRKRDKRKDLERYDVRTLVSERRRRPKDAFGRDVSPRVPSPSPSPPPREPPSPRASPSPRRSPPPPARRRARSAPRRRRRSTERARPKRRRSPVPSPEPKAKKKKRARSVSRSPRRRSPGKRARVRRRSSAACSPARSPAGSARTPPRAPSPPPPPEPRRRKRRDRSKHRRARDVSPPSKEVFTSGDNILVSVSFKEAEGGGLTRRLRRRERRRRRLRAAPAEPTARPVAIIDLERSPFRELTPPHDQVIVLSDEERPAAVAPEPAPPAAPCDAPPAPMPDAGPKTPPEPMSPGAEAAAGAEAEARGPNTPPEPPDSPDAYDPYEPTRSASASPARSPPAPAPAPPAPDPAPAPQPREMTLETAQKTNMSADEVLDRRPLSPMEKVMALLQSTRDVSPEVPPGGHVGGHAGGQTGTQETARVAAVSPTRPPQPKLFLAKPSPIKSDPIKPFRPQPQTSKISRLPLPTRGESPYSPGSSDFGDLFEPPAPRRETFDALFDKPAKKKRSNAAKVPVKLNKKKGKTQVDVKIDDASLKIMDELPSSAVEMQVKTKFLKKLNRQERVVEEVKLVLKPHYNKKHVTKDEYKHILRRTVPKICHNKSGEINPAKIQALVEAYVKKFRKKHKLGL